MIIIMVRHVACELFLSLNAGVALVFHAQGHFGEAGEGVVDAAALAEVVELLGVVDVLEAFDLGPGEVAEGGEVSCACEWVCEPAPLQEDLVLGGGGREFEDGVRGGCCWAGEAMLEFFFSCLAGELLGVVDGDEIVEMLLGVAEEGRVPFCLVLGGGEEVPAAGVPCFVELAQSFLVGGGVERVEEAPVLAFDGFFGGVGKEFEFEEGAGH